MANTLLTIDKITPRGLASLHDDLVFAKSVNREYDDQFAQSGLKIGSNLRIRKPQQPVVNTGKTAVVQDDIEQFLNLTFDVNVDQLNTTFQFGSAEMSLDLDMFADRVLDPAAKIIASKMEQKEINNCIKGVDNLVVSSSSLTSLDVLRANSFMTEQTCPTSERFFMVNPTDEVNYINANSNLFNAADSIAEQYKDAFVGRANGNTWMRSNRIDTITNGGTVSGTLSATTVEGGNTLVLAGLSNAQVIPAGTVITVAAVNGVQVETKNNVGRLRQMSVLETVTATSGGAATVTVNPLFASATDGRKNVDALPQNGAAFTIAGAADTTYRQSLAYNKNAFTIASADLELPQGGAKGARSVMEGISMRINKGWNILGDDDITRMDVFTTSAVLRPEYASKIWVPVT